MSFTTGCDPELFCRRNGQFVPAHNYFKANASFGLDGCESTAEIRPGYSESPIDLTSKIYQILDLNIITQLRKDLLPGTDRGKLYIEKNIQRSMKRYWRRGKSRSGKVE